MTDPRRLIAETDAILAKYARRGWSPHAPHARQKEFLESTELEVLYGGAAGGGKSDAMLMAALQYVDVPGYAAILFRRTYPDLALPGAIMDRAIQWLAGTEARWNATDKRFTFPSGATLSFGYLDKEKDKYRYQSSEFQFIGFDELTQFPKGWYEYLFSRLRRSAHVNAPLRMRGATNPGGIGHEWVRKRFIDPKTAKSRFVSAKLIDNPSLDADEYRRSLAELDTQTRRQLEEGDWVADTDGLVYSRFEPRKHVLPAALATRGWRFVLGIDYGFADECAFVVLGWAPGSRIVRVVESHKFGGMTPTVAAEFTRDLARRFDFSRIVGDTGGLGKGYAEEARVRFLLPIEAADKTNKRGYQLLLNDALANGTLQLFPGNEALQDEWSELPWNKTRAHEADGFANHLSDATLYGWRAASAFLEEPPADPRTPEQQALDAEEAMAQEPDEDNWRERLLGGRRR